MTDDHQHDSKLTIQRVCVHTNPKDNTPSNSVRVSVNIEGYLYTRNHEDIHTFFLQTEAVRMVWEGARLMEMVDINGGMPFTNPSHKSEVSRKQEIADTMELRIPEVEESEDDFGG